MWRPIHGVASKRVKGKITLKKGRMSKCELDRLENATKRSPNLKKNEIYKGQKGGICKAFRGHVK